MFSCLFIFLDLLFDIAVVFGLAISGGFLVLTVLLLLILIQEFDQRLQLKPRRLRVKLEKVKCD